MSHCSNGSSDTLLGVSQPCPTCIGDTFTEIIRGPTEAGPATCQSTSSQNNSQAEANSYTAVSASNRRLEGTWRNDVITWNPRNEQNLRKWWSCFKNL
jgi:hypothetical protein